MWYDTNKLKELNEIKIIIRTKRKRKGGNTMENFNLGQYKVSYTRDNINCYAYCTKVSARKLISEHGKKHTITSIIDMNTDEEIWNT